VQTAPGRVVSAVLDPVLVPAGFAPVVVLPGGDDPPTPTQVIFCARHDELSDRYPRLPQADEQERGHGGCVDLVVRVTSEGTIDSVDLESLSLEDTLRRVGLDADVVAVAGIEGRPLLEALPVLEASLRSLFVTAT
jgi:hypothetical protein